jgi:hypothetical protein
MKESSAALVSSRLKDWRSALGTASTAALPTSKPSTLMFNIPMILFRETIRRCAE